MALLDRAIARLLPAVPRPVVRRLSEPYIAGPRLEDACRQVKALNERGRAASIDVLGEASARLEEVEAIARAYHDVLAAIDRERLDANVSVKLSALGLQLDRDLCRERVEALVRDAAARGSFVRIDMEDSSTTDDTLRLYRELRERGHENVGVVLQAYLRRTLADVRALSDLCPNVRLCKGIYVEPPAVAYRDFEEVRASFVAALRELLAAGSYVGIATHDDWLVSEALRLVRAAGRDRDGYELQMLLGVRTGLGDRLVQEGHVLRVYVPFGERWYAYSVRRLQENPKIAGYVAADTLARLLPRRADY